MRHLTNIYDIEQALADHRICLFYIKAPDCGVCNVMLDKVESIVTHFPTLCSIYTDITEEPLIAGRFLVYGRQRGVSHIWIHQSGRAGNKNQTISTGIT